MKRSQNRAALLVGAVEKQLGPLQLSDSYIESFSKNLGIGREKAAASIETLIEVKGDYAKADEAIQKILGEKIGPCITSR